MLRVRLKSTASPSESLAEVLHMCIFLFLHMKTPCVVIILLRGRFDPTGSLFSMFQAPAYSTALWMADRTVSKSASVTSRDISTSEVVISRRSALVPAMAAKTLAAMPGVFFMAGS